MISYILTLSNINYSLLFLSCRFHLYKNLFNSTRDWFNLTLANREMKVEKNYGTIRSKYYYNAMDISINMLSYLIEYRIKMPASNNLINSRF